MKLSSLSQQTPMFCHSYPPWLRWCSIATLVTSVGLLWMALFAHKYRHLLAAGLVPLLLVALAFAVYVSAYSFWYLGKEHRQADQAFRNTDCEFSSVFQNVLDGILIVDNAGDCLDANPAATVILRSPANKLIGQNIGRFLDGSVFDETWNAFRRKQN